MFTLPLGATDDDLRKAVIQWFCLLATGQHSAAQEFLKIHDSVNAMGVNDFVSRVSELTSGGKVTTPEPIAALPLSPDGGVDMDALSDDPIVDLVTRLIPTPESSKKYPSIVGEVFYTIPVNGEWSQLQAVFFVCMENEAVSLLLRDILYDDDTEDDDNPLDVTPDDFVRCVTLDEHFRNDHKLVARGIIQQSALDFLRAEYEAREQPGDQWYEWQRGTEPMMGYGGMALVRNGVVVWANETWIS